MKTIFSASSNSLRRSAIMTGLSFSNDSWWSNSSFCVAYEENSMNYPSFLTAYDKGLFDRSFTTLAKALCQMMQEVLTFSKMQGS